MKIISCIVLFFTFSPSCIATNQMIEQEKSHSCLRAKKEKDFVALVKNEFKRENIEFTTLVESDDFITQIHTTTLFFEKDVKGGQLSVKFELVRNGSASFVEYTAPKLIFWGEENKLMQRPVNEERVALENLVFTAYKRIKVKSKHIAGDCSGEKLRNGRNT